MRALLSKKSKNPAEAFEEWINITHYEDIKELENSFNNRLRKFCVKVFGIGYVLPIVVLSILSAFFPITLPFAFIGTILAGPIAALIFTKNPPFKKLEHWKMLTRFIPQFKKEMMHYESMLNIIISEVQKPETQKLLMDFVLHAEKEGIPSYTYVNNTNPYYQYYHDKIANSILLQDWTHLLLQIEEISKHYEKIKYRKTHASAYQVLRAQWNEEQEKVEEVVHWWKK